MYMAFLEGHGCPGDESGVIPSHERENGQIFAP